MKKESKIATYDKAKYVERIAVSKSRIRSTKDRLIEWSSKLDIIAAERLVHLEPMMAAFPVNQGQDYTRLVCDIHISAKRYGTLGISIKSQTGRKDLGSLNLQGLTDELSLYCRKQDARRYAADFQLFNSLMLRIGGLAFMSVPFGPAATKGPVISRWLDAVKEYGDKCSFKLEDEFKLYLDLCEELEEAMFDFNASAGSIRYRNVRCSYVLDDEDPLGPSNPEIKVVASINPRTRSIRYNRLTDFKKKLTRNRVGKLLSQEIGCKPSKKQLDEAMASRRKRNHTPWMTKEVIKACYLGRKAKDIFEAQNNLIAVMQSWQIQRDKLQALL